MKLADVAKAAGVSQGTASNVFSRPQLVRQEVRDRVAASAARLGYSGPDPKGRLLRAGKVNAIGVVVSQKMTEFFEDPYNREFMAGIAAVCDDRGAGISLIAAADERNFAWSIESAVVDGLILQCVDDGERLIELARKRKLPFVATDSDAGPDMSSLDIDHRSGARQAMQHLLDLGHRRVGVLSLELADGKFPVWVDAERRANAVFKGTSERILGYDDALRAAGLGLADVPILEGLNDARAARHMAAMMFDAHPEITGLVAMSDVLALAAIAVAKKRGLSVPGDLSVVGFDDVPEAAAHGLTTVHQPIAEKGRRAAELILDGGAPRKETLPVSLIVRSSTAAPRSR